jgi:hypothetical protein
VPDINLENVHRTLSRNETQGMSMAFSFSPPLDAITSFTLCHFYARLLGNGAMKPTARRLRRTAKNDGVVKSPPSLFRPCLRHCDVRIGTTHSTGFAPREFNTFYITI